MRLQLKLRKIFLFAFFLSFLSSCAAQKHVNVGFGAGGGYKCATNSAGFFVGSSLGEHIEVYVAFAFDNFIGIGYTTGADFLLYKRNFQPFIGIGYHYQRQSGNLGFGEPPNLTIYTVDSHDNILVTSGVRWTLFFDDPSYNKYVTVSPYMAYRSLLKETRVSKKLGPSLADKELRINRRIDGGIGAGIKVMFYFGDRPKRSVGSTAAE